MKNTIYISSIILLFIQILIAREEKTITLSDLINDSIKTYTIDQIIVTDSFENFNSKISSLFTKKIHLSERLSSTSIGNLLATKSGIFTKNYGAEGSLQTISIRGTGSEYTSIFINGINYNNTLNGVFDFSKFTTDEITEITVKKGNDFDPANNNAFGGVIELNPFEKSDTTNYSVKIQTGSFRYNAFSVKTSGNFLDTYYKFNLSHKSAKNDYEYTFNDEKGVRKNSDVNQLSFNTALINKFSIFNKPILIKLFSNYLDKKFGLPNFVSSNRHLDSQTRENEKNFSTSINSKIIFSPFFFNSVFGFQKNRITIDDPLLSINLKTNFFETDEISTCTKFLLQYVANSFSIAGGVSTSLENFVRTETQNTKNFQENLTRKEFSFNLTSNYSRKIFTEDLLLNVVFFHSQNIFLDQNQSYKRLNKFPNNRFGISVKSYSYNLTVYTNAGSGFRTPNFYEIAFSKLTSLNNRELEPEKIFNFETGIRYINKSFTIEITYFNFDVINKIIWQPQRVAFFSPINAGRINSSGVEFNLEGLKIYRSLYFATNYTLTNAVKKTRLSISDNSYNKQLPYVPKHKLSTLFQFVNETITIDLNSNFYSRRFITEDNDELFSLDPVMISNFSTTIHFKILGINISSQLAIQNLFNTSYQLIQSFPMPGREYRLTIQMEVK